MGGALSAQKETVPYTYAQSYIVLTLCIVHCRDWSSSVKSLLLACKELLVHSCRYFPVHALAHVGEEKKRESGEEE